MQIECYEDKNEKLRLIEKQLRINGQLLDQMWVEARSLKGLARTEIHHRMGSLRHEQTLARKAQDKLKAS